MWLGNYEIVELKGSWELDRSVMSCSTCLWMQGLWLAAIISTFKIDPQWSWCSSVESCPLSKKSPTSWVMNGGHSIRQMPSWPLGHCCGIVSLQSVFLWWSLLMVYLPDGGRRGNLPGGPVWKYVPEAIAAAWSLLFTFLSPHIKFLFCFKHSERFLFHDKTSAWFIYC